MFAGLSCLSRSAKDKGLSFGAPFLCSLCGGLAVGVGGGPAWGTVDIGGSVARAVVCEDGSAALTETKE